MKAYIVILNWNGYIDTLECLESVFKLSHPNFQVILCDNDSSDNSIDHFTRWAEGKHSSPLAENYALTSLVSPSVAKPISYALLEREQAEKGNISNAEVDLIMIKTGGNLGFAGGNNVGLRYALKRDDFDYIWLLNNDTIVAPDCLSKMINYSQSHSPKNLCGSVQYFYHEPEIIQALGGCHYNKWSGIASDTLGRGTSIHAEINHANFEKQLSYIHGASWLLPKNFLTDIGLMSEDYFLYYEEIDWCIRNNDQYQLCYCPEAKVFHKEGASIGSKSLTQESSLFADFYLFRNKLKVTRKFYPEALLTVYITTTLQFFNRIRRGQWKKATVIAHILLGKQSYSQK
jgi:GT2 family glycosyltransferase